jgi:hypothetical protein
MQPLESSAGKLLQNWYNEHLNFIDMVSSKSYFEISDGKVRIYEQQLILGIFSTFHDWYAENFNLNNVLYSPDRKQFPFLPYSTCCRRTDTPAFIHLVK